MPNDTGAFGGFCAGPAFVDALFNATATDTNACVGPVTGFTDFTLNNIFTCVAPRLRAACAAVANAVPVSHRTIYGFMAIVIALFLASLCVIHQVTSPCAFYSPAASADRSTRPPAKRVRTLQEDRREARRQGLRLKTRPIHPSRQHPPPPRTIPRPVSQGPNAARVYSYLSTAACLRRLLSSCCVRSVGSRLASLTLGPRRCCCCCFFRSC